MDNTDNDEDNDMDNTDNDVDIDMHNDMKIMDKDTDNDMHMDDMDNDTDNDTVCDPLPGVSCFDEVTCEYMDECDACVDGETDWISNSILDNDSDGCYDAAEDLDDDNDCLADCWGYWEDPEDPWFSEYVENSVDNFALTDSTTGVFAYLTEDQIDDIFDAIHTVMPGCQDYELGFMRDLFLESIAYLKTILIHLIQQLKYHMIFQLME